MTAEEWGLELDTMLPGVTAEAVEKRLSGHKHLRLAKGYDWNWLATATRRALAIAHRYGTSHPDDPMRASDKQVRDELRAVARKARALMKLLRSLSPEAISKVQEGDDADYDRLISAAYNLASRPEQAAKTIKVPRKQVRSPQRKQMRVDWARYLAPVFEAAFGQNVTVANNTATTHHLALEKLSPFQFFYLSMAEIAFGNEGRADTDIVGVTKAARTLHRKQPLAFTPGIIPGL